MNKYCGRKETVGHGEFLICGEPLLGLGREIYQCDNCQKDDRIADLELLLIRVEDSDGRCPADLLSDIRAALESTTD